MMMTFISLVYRAAADPDVAGRVLQHVLGEPAQLELAQEPLVVDTQDHGVDALLYRLVHHGVTGLARLEELALNLEVMLVGYLLGLAQDPLSLGSLGRELSVKGQGTLNLNNIYYVHFPLV